MNEITNVWMETFERHPEKVLEVQMSCQYKDCGYALTASLTRRGKVKLNVPAVRVYSNGITKPIFLSEIPVPVRQWFNSTKPAILIALSR